VIQSRKRNHPNGKGVSKQSEFLYDESMDMWLTCYEMSKMRGCTVAAEGLNNRIRNKGKNPLFATLEGCIFTKKLSTSDRTTEDRNRTIEQKKLLQDKTEFYLWVMKLMTPCKYKPRTIGSR